MLELQDINDQLTETMVVSPMDGVLTNLLVEEGEIAVSATSGFQSGTSIGTVADISKLEVITQIGEVDYVHLSQGQKVLIKPLTIDSIHTSGTITFIALSAKKDENDELGEFEVWISVDSIIPGLAPGINVTVEFVIKEKKGVTGVPYHFIVNRGPKHFVLQRTPDGTVKRTPVVVGETDYRHYEIVSGVSEGDTVIFKPETEAEKREKRGRRGR
jgi:multidrug efflux pump subunit AcrA (membrane-fusion protein)